MKNDNLVAKLSYLDLKLCNLEFDLKWTLKMAFLPLSQASQVRVELETLLQASKSFKSGIESWIFAPYLTWKSFEWCLKQVRLFISFIGYQRVFQWVSVWPWPWKKSVFTVKNFLAVNPLVSWCSDFAINAGMNLFKVLEYDVNKVFFVPFGL